MNYKDPNTDSGKFINGVYTTKNGFSGSGLNCPKGTRLYELRGYCPVMFLQEGFIKYPGEYFTRITNEIAEGILPYYIISNYGRIINEKSGQIIKMNFRPNGYGYFCLAANYGKYGQRKYSAHRLVLKAFCPIPNSDQFQVNHKNGIKSDNTVNIPMPDGTIYSNLEWCTVQENVQHAEDNNFRGFKNILLIDTLNIRKLHDDGYSFEQINKLFYPNISWNMIQNICLNKMHYDPSYIPSDDNYRDSYEKNPANLHRLTNNEVRIIREMHNQGYSNIDINKKFPSYSPSTITDTITYKTHQNI